MWMDPNQKEFPILSYLLWRMDPGTHPPLPREAEQTLLTQYPHLTNPEVVSSLTQSIPSIITQTHLLLKALGPRPDPDAVSAARIKMAQIRETGETSKDLEIYKAVVRLEEMHEEYKRQLMEAEERLVGVYKEVAGDGEVNEEVVEILKEAEKGEIVERIDLSGRELRLIPEAFGKLRGLIALKLCNNQLEILPDSIAELGKLEVLDVSSNLLQTLPDTIGLLRSLKVLNVAGNRLTVLPESIALCGSLEELDVSFNSLLCLPTNIGYGLANLERLCVQLNKIRFLPQSICEMKSLRYLDAHFNELHGLPHAIGRLKNLEILNLSSNFNDFTELPDTIGNLTNLRELDLSNNQIRVLPSTFGGLEKLTKLNLDENPLVIPPKEIVSMGIEAVMEYMKRRREELMAAEELQRNVIQANQQQAENGWLAWGTSMLNNFVSGVSQGVSRYLGGADAPKDPYIDQQL